jgi:hypothetical protein
MNRNTVKLLLAALCLTTACDTWPQQVPAQGTGELAAPPKPSTGDDCAGCYKWSARPPSGVNGPVMH